MDKFGWKLPMKGYRINPCKFGKWSTKQGMQFHRWGRRKSNKKADVDFPVDDNQQGGCG